MGEFDASRMRQFVKAARDLGFRKVVEEQMLTEDPNARTVLLSSDRASFVDWLVSASTDSALDYGAGMGAISRLLAKSFKKVYALDLSFERLTFLQVVADEEKTEGINTVCHRDVYNLPFRSSSLDVVVLVGVFEYLPLSYPDDSVSKVQSRALNELHRIISPGGVLFIATKNRFGWPYWTGAIDCSHLRFGSLMPRPMADRVSRMILHRPYRIVTDSYRGYTQAVRYRCCEVHWIFTEINRLQQNTSRKIFSGPFLRLTA
jgi:SAM-dependent methyltransferase